MRAGATELARCAADPRRDGFSRSPQISASGAACASPSRRSIFMRTSLRGLFGFSFVSLFAALALAGCEATADLGHNQPSNAPASHEASNAPEAPSVVP